MVLVGYGVHCLGMWAVVSVVGWERWRGGSRRDLWEWSCGVHDGAGGEEIDMGRLCAFQVCTSFTLPQFLVLNRVRNCTNI